MHFLCIIPYFAGFEKTCFHLIRNGLDRLEISPLLTFRASVSLTFIGKVKVDFSVFRVFLLLILCPRENGRTDNSHLGKEKQPRVVVGPGNEHFISTGQVSSDAATMQRAERAGTRLSGPRGNAFTPPPPPMCIDNVMIRN